MSNETMTALNINTLIGMTAQRGNAWHYRAELQGGESNHYEGAIPVGDIQRRLFAWEAIARRVAVEVPATIEDMTHLDNDGNPVRWAVQEDRQAIARSDDDYVMGIFKDGYQPHQYDEWLLGGVSTILGDTLIVSSAGVLKHGALAWVEVSMPETRHLDRSGVDYRPNLLGGTSFDGSVATFWKAVFTNTVCDNTFAAARSEKGPQYKIKHTKNSGFKLEDARAALGIIHQEAEAFEAQVEQLVSTTVTDQQWFKFLDAYVPTLDADGTKLTGATLTKRENKRDQLSRLWVRDNRVEPWKNTAWGVVQAVNTWGHHEQSFKGGDRAQRNMMAAITGTQAKEDAAALDLLDGILANR